MKKYLRFIILAILGLIVIPILIAQYTKTERRGLQGVRLKDTSFREISFQNTKQDINLGGMLFVPEGGGPFPAAVIIHGSGTSHRDSYWYLT